MAELEKEDYHSEDDAKMLKEFLEEDDPFVDDDKDPDWVEEYKAKGNKLELNDASSSDLSVMSEEKSDPVFKKRKRMPREGSDEEKGSDNEYVKEKKLSIDMDDEEKRDMNEMSLLLSIRDSVQEVSQRQDEIVDLIVDFVKKRQSL